MEHVVSGKKLWEEETFRRQEKLSRDHRQDIERRERQQRLLVEFGELRRTTQKKNSKEIRKNLDKQCVSLKNYRL